MSLRAFAPTCLRASFNSLTFSRISTIVLAAGVVAIVVSPVIHLLITTLAEPDAIARVFADPMSWALLGRSVTLAGMVSVASMALGTALAWLSVRAAWPAWWRMTVTVLLCSALAVPSYVTAFGLIAATGPGGLLAPLLPGGLVARAYPLISAWIVITCCTFPYVMLSVRSTLLRECGSYEEAALSVGASRARAFFRIVLPRLMPSIVWGGMLAALYALADFGAVSLVGYETLTWGIYSRYDTAFGLDEARALCLMLIALTIMLLVLMRLVRPEFGPATAAVPICQSPVSLGPWNIAAGALIVAPVFFGVVLPVTAALDWLLRGDALLAALTMMAEPAWSTLTIAAMAAIIVPALALPIASMHLGRARRVLSGVRGIITPLTLIGFALPGIVIAIAGAGLALSVDGFIESALRLPVENRLYQSQLVLLLAYAALFLPEAVGPLRSSALRIHPEQLDAASQFGGRPMMDWTRIALPQLAPGLAAGAALVFVTTAKELPATLILAPPGVQTLATRLWGAMDEAFFTQAAAAALLLLLISAAGLIVVLAMERAGATR
jgi:iron(III) transport system permease protein